MLQSRLREIRKAKGLTLQEVADRIKPHGTTAQTIGRLETGRRTLSVEWIERIADALDCDPSALLALPEGGDLEISGDVSKGGCFEKKTMGTLALRLTAKDSIALYISDGMGQYRPGDIVVCNRLAEADFSKAEGSDSLIMTEGGRQYFAKIARGGKKGTFTLLPLAASGKVIPDRILTMIAPAVMLYRDLC